MQLILTTLPIAMTILKEISFNYGALFLTVLRTGNNWNAIAAGKFVMRG